MLESQLLHLFALWWSEYCMRLTIYVSKISCIEGGNKYNILNLVLGTVYFLKSIFSVHLHWLSISHEIHFLLALIFFYQGCLFFPSWHKTENLLPCCFKIFTLFQLTCDIHSVLIFFVFHWVNQAIVLVHDILSSHCLCQ